MAINIGIPPDHSATYTFWKRNQKEIIDKHIEESLQAFKLSGLKFSEEYEEYVIRQNFLLLYIDICRKKSKLSF